MKSSKVKVTASGYFYNLASRSPDKAIDGDETTYYTSTNKMDWIQFDLGGEYDVAGFSVVKRLRSEKYFVNIEVREGL